MSHIRDRLTARFKIIEDQRKEVGRPFTYMELRCDGPDCAVHIRETDEATALGAIIHKAQSWKIGENLRDPDYCWSCDTRGNYLHEPRRTADGNPAHGCEACDGEDLCTCSKGNRAACLTCGRNWPDCMRRK